MPRGIREVAIFASIIGLLASLAFIKVGRWSHEGVNQIQMKIRCDLKAIIHAAEIYRLGYGRFPGTLQEMKGTASGGSNSEPLLERTSDWWGREYIYELTPQGTPRVRCLGKDGVEGGEKENQDFEEPAPRSG